MLRFHQYILPLMLTWILGCSQQPGKYANFDDYPVYDGNDLELVYTPEESRFTVWSPPAEEVKLYIYDKGSGGSLLKEIPMKKGGKGTWTASLLGDWKGRFYTFTVKADGKWLDETPGVYAKAVGINGKRAAIINMEETNPEGWKEYQRPALKAFTDIVLYELHVRDMSIHTNSGIKNKGKFLGLTETGTLSPEKFKTGIDHIEELGVTHVHILPAFDFRSIDEEKLHENVYNWGYDPQNYDVPEGSYSTDPANPVSRIKEFKQMVMAFHQKGIRVIMDVVYNHTGETEKSNFNLMVPGYYYRKNADGTWSNASGCGNETASERPMMRQFMIQSLKHWVNEYHIDGFRFDLMGIHDIETMNEIAAELHKTDSTIFLYGEGWTAGASPLPEEKQALKKYTFKLNKVAAFSDDFRDAVKGHWNDVKTKGFVSGEKGMEESVKFGIVAATGHPEINYKLVNYSKEPWAKEPSQCINYVSCHDNNTLWDKLLISAPEATVMERIKMDKLANAMVLLSQGVPFLHAGEEFLRTKHEVHNSFNSPDSINWMDYSRKALYIDVFKYYQDLLQLRKSHPAFRMPANEMIQERLSFLKPDTINVVGFMLKDHANGDEWKDVLVIFNANKKPVSVSIPQGPWTVVAYEGMVNTRGLRTFNHNRVEVPAISALVLKR